MIVSYYFMILGLVYPGFPLPAYETARIASPGRTQALPTFELATDQWLPITFAETTVFDHLSCCRSQRSPNEYVGS
jgi:hypothetical protein